MAASPPSPARKHASPHAAAQPLLASSILALSKGVRGNSHIHSTNQGTSPTTHPLRTACPAIDDAVLAGGFPRRAVSLVSGPPRAGKTALALHALATLLVPALPDAGARGEGGEGHDDDDDAAAAVVVDASGALDVLALHAVVLGRVRRRREEERRRRRAALEAGAGEEAGGEDGDDAAEEEEAGRALDRVKVMRVFDFVGLAEAVGEVVVELEGGARGVPLEGSDHATGNPREGGKTEAPLAGRLEVPDSDEEDPDADMLFSGTAASHGDRLDGSSIPAKAGLNEPQQNQDTLHTGHAHTTTASEKTPKKAKIGLLVIDNIATVVAPLLKKNYVHAHALLTPFMRHLALLTRQHSLCTIIVNGTVPLHGYRDYGTHQPAPRLLQQPQAATPPDRLTGAPGAEAEDNPSVFACNAVKPALGSTFAGFADLHLLVTRVPLGKRDAAAMLDGLGGGTSGTGRVAATASVVEVIADRYGGRVGRWAAVHVDVDGSIRAAL